MINTNIGFKRNITITLACVITECLISLIPAIFMFYLFFMMDKIGEIFSTLLVIPYLILIINVVLIIISFIAQRFVKEINYKEIVGITYDYGDLTKFHTKPSQLILFDKEYNELLSVNNPSIIMVHMIKKKCKHAKVGYYHNKRFLYILLIINVLVLFAILLVKILL